MNQIEKYIVEPGATNVEPIIVLTGDNAEFMDFCALTNRNTVTALAVRQGFQIDFYPDAEIALYGNYGLNAAFDSPEYKQRVRENQMRGL